MTAYSHASKEDRLFLVDCMSRIELTDERFELPQGYAVGERFSQLFGLIEEAPQDIKLRISADVAHFFRESQWHASQHLVPEKDGTLLVTFKAGGLEEMARWILSWGKEVKVLEPPKLVSLVERQLTAALRHYTGR